MSVIERLTKAAHLIDMDDIIREGHPTLRQVAEEVAFPLSDQEIILGEKMMQFLKHSQDPVMAEKMKLRGGVGLAAPQIDVSKRIIAVLVPNPEDEEGNPPAQAYSPSKRSCTTLKSWHILSKKRLWKGARAAYPLTAKSKATLSAMRA